MPKTKSVESAGKTPDECILKMGKQNNVIQWREEMYNLATGEFGEVGTYFYINVAFKFPFPHEREYNPFYVEPIAEAPIMGGDDDDEDEDFEEDQEEDIGVVVEKVVPALAPEPALPEATRLALVNKLREGAYEARRKRVEAAHLALRKRGYRVGTIS